MKQKKIMIILILCIVLAVIVDMYLIFASQKDVNVRYRCIANSSELSMDTEDYSLMTTYNFSFNKDGLSNAQMVQMFFFRTQEAFDNFSYETFNTQETPISSDTISGSLQRNYTFKKSIPADSKNIKSYIKKLEDMDFECTILESEK